MVQPKAFAMKGGKSKASNPKKADTKLSVKKKTTGGDRVAKKAANAAKDPSKPKRKTYKEKHPNNKFVSVVGKAGGDKWKSMFDAEKAPYVAKAEKRKSEYNKSMQAYNKKLAEGNDVEEEEESDKSKSEVNEEDDEEESDEVLGQSGHGGPVIALGKQKPTEVLLNNRSRINYLFVAHASYVYDLSSIWHGEHCLDNYIKTIVV